jgi:hypothetical protein
MRSKVLPKYIEENCKSDSEMGVYVTMYRVFKKGYRILGYLVFSAMSINVLLHGVLVGEGALHEEEIK